MPTAAELVDRLTLAVPDFPEPGVLFRDLTPTLADAEGPVDETTEYGYTLPPVEDQA